MADYLGSSEDVDYLTFQTQMLKRDRELGCLASLTNKGWQIS